MSRVKIVVLIVAGILAIAPAASAHGVGGRAGGGYRGGAVHSGHFARYSRFAGGHWHRGDHGYYWQGGRWYGGRYYGGGYWDGGQYWLWGYPFDAGCYDYDY
jgi:hypothetical protein